MKKNRTIVLNQEEIEKIHEMTLDLLEKIGVKIENSEAIDLLLSKGALFDTKTQNVLFPKSLVENSLKNVPKSFNLYGPNEDNAVSIDINSTIFATQGSPSNIYDKTRESLIRNALLDDFKDYIRIVNTLDQISCCHLDVWPTDVPYEEVLKYTIPIWGRFGKKPFGSGCRGKKATQEMMDLLSIIAGSKKNLKEKPRCIIFYNPTSPLKQPDNLIEGLFIATEYCQPIIVASAATGGLTAPITLAGLLLQTNMEVLSAIVLIQLMNPGNPVLYGAVNSPMDPNYSNVTWGSVETSLLTIASAQLARYYEIPSRAPGAITSSNSIGDIQSGFERIMNLSAAVDAGINYVTCAGTYANGESTCLELMVIDNELVSVVLRSKEGININENTLAMHEIEKLVRENKSSFLGTRFTSKNMRKELFIPRIIERSNYNRWLDDEKPTMLNNAAILIEKIKSDVLQSNLSIEKETLIQEYLQNLDES